MDGAVLSHFPPFYFPRPRKKKGRKEKEKGGGGGEEKSSPLPLRETLRNYVSSRKNVIYGVCSSLLAVGYIFPRCFSTFCTYAHTEHRGTRQSLILPYGCMIIYPAFFSSRARSFIQGFSQPDFSSILNSTISEKTLASKDLHCNVVYVILGPLCFESDAL